MNDAIHKAKVVGDYAAGAVVGAALLKWLPPLAAAAALVYHLLGIWEKPTTREAIARLRAKLRQWRSR